MLAFKKLNFDYYPAMRNGKFLGELISVNKKEGTVTGYDGGSYFMQGRNYKWVAKIDSGKLHGTSNWSAVRITNLTQNCG